MIIDYNNKETLAVLFDVIDLATGKPIEHPNPYFYADDEKAIVRSYDLNDDNHYFIRHPVTKSPVIGVVSECTDNYLYEDGSKGYECEAAWTEYYVPIKIIPKPLLTLVSRRHCLEKIAQFEFLGFL